MAERWVQEPAEVVRAEQISVSYRSNGWGVGRRSAPLVAVQDVSFSITRGRTFGLVGESGSGKSSLALALLRLIEPSSGTIWINGQNIRALNQTALRGARRNMQMIFQDPYGSLSPKKTVREAIRDSLLAHRIGNRSEQSDRISRIADMVQLKSTLLERYPHELSGGQRQRVAIARALVLEPALLVCDEPTSALDVSVQAQIANLLLDLQDQLGLTYLFVSHDLGLVRYMAHVVGVMHLGRLVELGPSEDVLRQPLHPYTRVLRASVSDIGVRAAEPSHGGEAIAQEKIMSSGDGCRFRFRCSHAFERCATVEPVLVEFFPNHCVSCHLYEAAPPTGSTSEESA